MGQVSFILPSDANLYATPVQLLATRWVPRANQTVQQGLIHWSGTLAAEDTWEDLEELKACFPRSPAWGQARFQEEGIVSSLTRAQVPEAQLEMARPKRTSKPNQGLRVARQVATYLPVGTSMSTT
jgi:hypothetical protein